MSLPVAILAGGLATRLSPITEKIPKSLLDIDGEPFILHQFSLLRSKGIDRVVVCVGYLGEMIQSLVGDGGRYGLKVEYSYDGKRLLGTGGAIKKALPMLGESFFVLYGDSYLPCNYMDVQAAFESCGKEALMTVRCSVDASTIWDTRRLMKSKNCATSLIPSNWTPRSSLDQHERSSTLSNGSAPGHIL